MNDKRREQNRKWMRKWRAAHLEKARERDRHWRAANPEKVAAYRIADREKSRQRAEQFRAKNPDVVRERERRYRQRNKVAIAARRKAKDAEYRATHKTQVKDYNRRYRQENRERLSMSSRNAALLRKYGISADDWDRLLRRQGERCAICRIKDPGGRYNKWHTDHCHDGGHVRGLLCFSCNNALGSFRHDPDLLRRAARYLEESLGEFV